MIEFECSECGKQLRVKEEAAGKKGKCPQCGTMLRVPDSSPALPHEPATSAQASDSAKEHPSMPSAGDLSHPAEPSETREDAEPVAGDGSDQHLDQPTKIAMAAGGIGLVILALSPLFKWVNFGTGGVTGISGDGKIVLGITIVSAIAFAIAVFTRKRIAAASLVVGAWGTVALFWMGGLIWKVGSLLDSPDVQDNPFAAMLVSQVSPGAGLYLGLVGGLVVAGALGFVTYRQLQLVDRSRLFYIAQSCALALGVIVAVLIGPESGTGSNERAAASTPASPFSFSENDDSVAGEREHEATVSEIEQLRAKLSGEKRDVLEHFVIERSRFKEADTGFSREKVIVLAVRNDTDQSVSRAYFHAVLLTPGREMPWVDDHFNYQITGGLEPGESATWNLSPNMFGAWSDAPYDRNDLVLIVRPVRLDGSNGSSFTGERFTDRDAERLRELLESTEYVDAAQAREELAARDEAIQEWRDTAVREAVQAEVEYLRSLQAEAEAVKESLAKFEIERAEFYFSEDRFSSDPVIDLTVTNGTRQAVSRFYCRGVLSSPGRETPWVDETINYSVRGGIQPGETRQFRLAPNMFGAWGEAPKDRQDMEFSVTVYQLDGADETELFPFEFSENDANRLTAIETIIRERGW